MADLGCNDSAEGLTSRVVMLMASASALLDEIALKDHAAQLLIHHVWQDAVIESGISEISRAAIGIVVDVLPDTFLAVVMVIN